MPEVSANPLDYKTLNSHQIQQLVSQRDSAIQSLEEATAAHAKSLQDQQEMHDAELTRLRTEKDELIASHNKVLEEMKAASLRTADESDQLIKSLRQEIDMLGGTEKAQEIKRQKRQQEIADARAKLDAEEAALNTPKE